MRTSSPAPTPLLNASEMAAICDPANQAAQGNPTETISGPGGVSTTLPGLNVYTYRRNVEGGGRTQSFGNNAIRTLVGVKGDFADAWKFDVYAQHSSVDGTSSQGNYLSNLLVPNALNVITGPALLANGSINPNAGQARVRGHVFRRRRGMRTLEHLGPGRRDQGCIGLSVGALAHQLHGYGRSGRRLGHG